MDALRLAEFDPFCMCPDPCGGRYDPCEAGCGARIAWHHNGFVEDDVAHGCHPPTGSHCLSWTTHTPERCRDLRGLVRPHDVVDPQAALAEFVAGVPAEPGERG